MLNNQQLAMMIVNAAWSLTVGGVSGPGVAHTINDETGAEIGDDIEDASILMGARLMPGAMLAGIMLESAELLSDKQ